MENLTGQDLIETILWYDFCDSSILLPLLELTIEHIQTDTYISSYTPIPFEDNPIEMRDFFGEELYSAFVLLYGDYGINPRCGWISDLKNFKKLISKMIKREVKWGLN